MYNVYLNNVKHGETNEKQYLVPNLETGREHEFKVDDGINESVVTLLVPTPEPQYPAINIKLDYPTFSGAAISWDLPPYADNVRVYHVSNNGVYVGSTNTNEFVVRGELPDTPLILTMEYETKDNKISPESNALTTRTLPVSNMKLTVDDADITTTTVMIGSSIIPFDNDNLRVNLNGNSDNITNAVPKVKFINLTSGENYSVTGVYTADFGTSKPRRYNVEGVTFTMK